MAAPNKETFIPIKTTLPKSPLPDSASRGTILTPRLLLRSITQADLQAYHTIRTDAEIMKWTVQGRVDHDLAETQEKLNLFLPPNDVLKCNWAICLRDGNKNEDGEPELIGIGGVHIFSSTFGWPELGYMIRRDYWGLGLATEFLGAFVKYWVGGEGAEGSSKRLEREETIIWVDERTLEGAVVGRLIEYVKVKKMECVEGATEEKEIEAEVEMEIPVVEEQLLAVTSEHNGKSHGVLRKNGFEEFLTWTGTEPDGSSIGLPTFRYFPLRQRKE
ncbi:acyl-CoA N-acyltransferase [Rhypophila sp. PSN 637]